MNAKTHISRTNSSYFIICFISTNPLCFPLKIRLLFVMKRLKQPLISQRERNFFCGTVKTASDTARERIGENWFFSWKFFTFTKIRTADLPHQWRTLQTARLPRCPIFSLWKFLFFLQIVRPINTLFESHFLQFFQIHFSDFGKKITNKKSTNYKKIFTFEGVNW